MYNINVPYFYFFLHLIYCEAKAAKTSYQQMKWFLCTISSFKNRIEKRHTMWTNFIND